MPSLKGRQRLRRHNNDAALLSFRVIPPTGLQSTNAYRTTVPPALRTLSAIPVNRTRKLPRLQSTANVTPGRLRRRLRFQLTEKDGGPFENARKESGLESTFECSLAETILANADGEKTRKLVGSRLG
jgi:hypothetical protein